MRTKAMLIRSAISTAEAELMPSKTAACHAGYARMWCSSEPRLAQCAQGMRRAKPHITVPHAPCAKSVSPIMPFALCAQRSRRTPARIGTPRTYPRYTYEKSSRYFAAFGKILPRQARGQEIARARGIVAMAFITCAARVGMYRADSRRQDGDTLHARRAMAARAGRSCAHIYSKGA